MLHQAFHLLAPIYDWLTANRLWHESLHEMARHLPPSGPTLRLVDVGGGPANSACALYQLRPDLSIAAVDISVGMLRAARRKINQTGANNAIQLVRADGLRLPFAANSVDAITAHSLYYLIAAQDQALFLAEAKRILRPGGRLIMLDPADIRFPFGVIGRAPLSAPSVLLWQAVSRVHQRVTPESMGNVLDAAGFVRVFGEKAVAGYGVLSRGEKQCQESSRQGEVGERIWHGKKVAVKPKLPTGTLPVVRGQALSLLPNPYIFLLIRQTPAQPSWALPPGTTLTWNAVTAIEINSNQCVVLAFTSLPKAVAFMQPAVTSGRIIGVSRIAKFDKTTATHWPFATLLNPDLSILDDTIDIHPTVPYRLSTADLMVDPNTAVGGDE